MSQAATILATPTGANGSPIPVSASNPLPVNATVNATASAVATAAAPSYGEGTTQSLSMDLAGSLRIGGTISASSSIKSTAADPSYSEGVTTNPLSCDLAGYQRVKAKQSGTWTVGIDQTTPGTTNLVAVSNLPVTVDVNSGNKSSSTLRVVLATDQPALTNKLLVTPDSVALPANQSVNVSQINGVTTLMGNGATGTGSQRVTIANDSTAIAGWGQGATGAAVPSGAEYLGLIATTANPTAATAGNLVGAMADKLGKQVVVGAIRTLKGTQKASLSNTTAETTIVTAVASTFLDLYGLILANTGATTTKVDIRDTTGGSIIATIEVPTLETRGFMVPVDSGIPQTTVNTNWTAQCASATTAMEITAFYVKNI